MKRMIYETSIVRATNCGYAGEYIVKDWKPISVSKYYFLKMRGIEVRKRPSNIPKSYPGDHLQGLFNLMHKEHGLILLESEMDDIIHEVEKMQGPKFTIDEAAEIMKSALAKNFNFDTDQERKDCFLDLISYFKKEAKSRVHH